MMGFMRHNELCDCGCGGYCSIHGMLQVAAWQLEALTDGLVPRERHDGTPWPTHICPSDVGKKLGVRCVVLYVKGDWAEFSKSMGLAGWGNTWQPCPICPVQKDAMHA
eukprot:3903048-Pyramimonas_sp.AAC.1